MVNSEKLLTLENPVGARPSVPIETPKRRESPEIPNPTVPKIEPIPVPTTIPTGPKEPSKPLPVPVGA